MSKVSIQWGLRVPTVVIQKIDFHFALSHSAIEIMICSKVILSKMIESSNWKWHNGNPQSNRPQVRGWSVVEEKTSPFSSTVLPIMLWMMMELSDGRQSTRVCVERLLRPGGGGVTSRSGPAETHANRQSISVRKSSLLTAALKEKCLPQVTQGWSHPAHCHHRPQQQLLVEELLRKTRPEASKSQQGGLDRKKSEGDRWGNVKILLETLLI